MTASEKAVELVNKFNNPDRTNYPYVHNALQCALIAVDEIIEIVGSDETAIIVELPFWQEVKQEIEKL